MGIAPSLRLAVYDAQERLRATFAEAEDAALYVAQLGAGTTVRDGWGWSVGTLWTEGAEVRPAAGNADLVASFVYSRLA